MSNDDLIDLKTMKGPVGKPMALLFAIARSKNGLTIAELSKELDLPKKEVEELLKIFTGGKLKP